MLVAGVAITVVGPAELGIVDDETDGGATTTDPTETTGTAAATVAASAGPEPETGANASAPRNPTDDGESAVDAGSSGGSVDRTPSLDGVVG